MTHEIVEQHASFGGTQQVWSHRSEVLGCDMRVGVYLPPAAADGPCPVVTFLSGLTCTEQNVVTKSGLQRIAAELGLIVVCPDTSPRGDHVADDEGWDLGKGAGFYVDATEAPWAANYQMATYVLEELRGLVDAGAPTTGAESILGHSMGGHGALVLALRNPGRFQAVSAFSPIVAPSQVPWGHKAFSAYLGDDRSTWAAWDATELIATAEEQLPILIDQGLDDSFLERELQPERLEAAAAAVGHPVTVRRHAGYDHSYYFIASFLEDHLRHHAAALKG